MLQLLKTVGTETTLTVFLLCRLQFSVALNDEGGKLKSNRRTFHK